MSAISQAAWQQRLNHGVAAKDVGRCSEDQAFFELPCGHLAYKTPKTISDKEKQEPGVPDAGLRCRQCDFHAGRELANPPSVYEIEAWALVDFCFDGPILLETSVLGHNWGLTDVWLPYWDVGALLDLIIMIDGEGHFNKQTFSTSPHQQQDIDRRFNAKCWEQEHKLLRLHFGDRPSWMHLLTLALRMCEMEPLHKFQLFSQSYEGRGWEANRHAPMNFQCHRTAGAYFKPS